MKQFLIKDLDEDLYKIDHLEEPVGGSRPRLLLSKKTTKLKYFLKTYCHDSREIFSELLGSELGKLLGLNIQKVSVRVVKGSIEAEFRKRRIPPDWKPIAALVRNAFKKDFDILYGKGVVGGDTEHFKLADIEKAIRARYYAPDDIFVSFAKMVVFDAFIGNMDRHHENWGIAEHRSVRAGQTALDPKELVPSREFATLFDHGSSLLFELDEARVEFFLKNLDAFESGYILGKSYSFFLDENGGESNIFILIRDCLKNDTWKKFFKKAIKDMFNDVASLDIARLILKMPRHEYVEFSDNRKSLLFESLVRRKKQLLSLL